MNIGVLLLIVRGINLGKIPRKFSDIYRKKSNENFRHILGKIPKVFFKFGYFVSLETDSPKN
jgi:hypothetical protein